MTRFATVKTQIAPVFRKQSAEIGKVFADASPKEFSSAQKHGDSGRNSLYPFVDSAV